MGQVSPLATTSEVCVPQQEKPLQRVALMLQVEKACEYSKDPAQRKMNKLGGGKLTHSALFLNQYCTAPQEASGLQFTG